MDPRPATKGATPPWTPLERFPVASHGAYQPLVKLNGEDIFFHHVPSFSDGLLAQMFSREVFALLLGEELVSKAVVEKIMGRRHSGFSVHSKVRAVTKDEAERVGKYMIRPLLSLERLSFSDPQGL